MTSVYVLLFILLLMYSGHIASSSPSLIYHEFEKLQYLASTFYPGILQLAHQGSDDHPCHRWVGITCSLNSRTNQVYVSSIEWKHIHTKTGISLDELDLMIFTKLQSLRLVNCSLAGFIPPHWSWMELQVLDLRDNELGGELPSNWFSLFPKLRQLHLGNNGHFTGSFPWQSLWRQSKTHRYIERIELQNNAFEGTLPIPSFTLPNSSFLPELQVLNVQNNSFSGSFQWTNLPRLLELHLGSNEFTGSLRPSFSRHAVDLQQLNLSYNHFSGQLPVELTFLWSLQQLDIRHNQFSGLFPLGFQDHLLLHQDRFGGENQTFWCPVPASFINPCHCSPNAIKTAKSSTRCIQCPAGTQAVAETCRPCPPGEFNIGKPDSFCQACPVGTFASQEGSISCTRAPAGSFVNIIGATSSFPCPKGTYSNDDDDDNSVNQPLDSCRPCPVGQFTNETQSQSCRTCPPGSYALNVGSYVCSKCPLGTYSSHSSTKNVCQECPVGTFGAVAGATSCTPCPVGTFRQSLEPRVCQKCLPGMYASKEGSVECDYCPRHSFSSRYGHAHCRVCPAGKFTRTSGQNQCQGCPAGTTTTMYVALNTSTRDDEARLCRPCSVDECKPLVQHHQPNGSSSMMISSLAKPCPAGYSRTSKGGCQACPEGTFGAASSSKCTRCPRGSFSPSSGQTSCTLAPPGTYVRISGSSQARECPLDSFSSTRGSVLCRKCLPGTFTTFVGQTQCQTLEKSKIVIRKVMWIQLDFKTIDIDSGRNNKFQQKNEQQQRRRLLRDGLLRTLVQYQVKEPVPVVTLNTTSSATGFQSLVLAPWNDSKAELHQLIQIIQHRMFLDVLLQHMARLVSHQKTEVYYPRTWSAVTFLNDARKFEYFPTKVSSPCLPGYYQVEHQEEAGICRPCPRGTFSPGFGAQSCEKCPRDTFQMQLASQVCDACPANTHRSREEPELECRTCPWIVSEFWNFDTPCTIGLAMAYLVGFVVVTLGYGGYKWIWKCKTRRQCQQQLYEELECIQLMKWVRSGRL